MGPFDRIGAGERFNRRHVLGQAREQSREVMQLGGDHVDHAGLLLQLPGDGDVTCAQNGHSEPLECLRPDDDVGHCGLVFDCHEDDAVRRARSLANGDEPGDGDAFTRAPRAQLVIANDAAGDEVAAQEGCGMRAQRQFEEAVVVHDLLAQPHKREIYIRFAACRYLVAFR